MRISKILISLVGTFSMLSILLFSCGRVAPLPGDVMVTEAIDAAAGPGANWKDAKAKAYKAVKYYPQDPNARVMLGLALEQCGQANNALDEMKNAVELDKKNFMAQFNLGRMLIGGEHYDEALGPLKTALSLSPGNENVLVLLGRVSNVLGLYDDAIKYYAALARGERYANSPEPYNEIGMALVKKGEYDKAYAILVEGLKKNNGNPSVIINLAILCDKHLNKKDTAIKLYQKYIEATLKNSELEGKRAEVNKRMKTISGLQ